MKCPSCSEEIGISLTALESESISLVLKWEGALVEARTVGGMIDGARKLLIAAAKEAGVDMVCMMHSIEWGEHEAKFNFLLLPPVKKRK